MKGVRGWAVVALAMLGGGCERMTGPARPGHPAVPMVEVSMRRFDSLEWPLDQRRIQLPDDGVLETIARILRFPEKTPPVTGIEIRDASGWEALWADVAPGDSLRVPAPVVDFTHDMVYVVIAEDYADQPPLERIDIERVLRSESRYSVYTTTWIIPAHKRAKTRLIDAVVVPVSSESVTLFVSGPMPARRAPAQ